AAFGLAANTLQVVDFTAKLLSAGQQIFKDGSTVQSAELELVANDLKVLTSRLKLRTRPDPNVLGPIAQNTQDLAHESEKIAQELIDILSTIRVKGETLRCRCLLHAIKTMWNKEKIEETVRRLETIRGELQSRISISAKEENLLALDEATQNIVKSLLENRSDVTAAIAAHADDIVREYRASEVASSRRHKQLLYAISKTKDWTVEPDDLLRWIKANLHYQRIHDRFDDIVKAHQETFSWILEEDQDCRFNQGPKMLEWLREGSRIYWTTGKAGSGKSTLLKNLHQDPRLAKALQSWARAENCTLIILSFYFWNAGIDLQKSQEGLLRSLLLQAPSEQPLLGPILFPEQFEFGARLTEFPTFHDLRRAFKRLTDNLPDTFRIALLIDGLDEFDATHVTISELADIFIAATKSPNVKALLSSRPLPAFEASFGDRPKLHLHELTQADITAYVDAELSRHPRILELFDDDPEGITALIAEIVDAAAGVFLWVKLVVRSLLEGLHNYDLMPDLRERLTALPRDLEDLFRHMLRNIPPNYKAQSSRIFQIHSTNEMHDYTFGYVSLTPLGLYFAEMDVSALMKAEVVPLSALERERRRKEVEGRLKSRCAGLLEFRSRAGNLQTHLPMAQLIVYLHRTVADFLKLDEVWDGILDCTRGGKFDPHLSLLQSLIMRSNARKRARQLGLSKGPIRTPLQDLWRLVSSAMQYARLSEGLTKTAHLEVLDELDRAMTSHFNVAQERFEHNPSS
ncbi:hypothetical protein K458DRAFT_313435, partial [Lentithecium fluviatile CBS 122367]